MIKIPLLDDTPFVVYFQVLTEAFMLKIPWMSEGVPVPVDLHSGDTGAFLCVTYATAGVCTRVPWCIVKGVLKMGHAFLK